MSAQQHLLSRRYPTSPYGVLMALCAHERSAGVAVQAEIEDELSSALLDCLGTELFDTACLNPANWLHARPHLTLTAALSARGHLTLDAAPPLSRQHRKPEGWLFDDFGKFHILAGAPGVRLLSLELDQIVSPGPLEAQQRKLVFSVYEYLLKKLGYHFQCELASALVCLGSECALVVRQLARLQNPVEFANLVEQDDALWHPQLQHTFDAVKVAPREALSFYRGTLKALLPEQQARVWAEFLGSNDYLSGWTYANGERFFVLPEALQLLALVDDPVRFPPLTPSNAAQARQVLDDMRGEVGAEKFIDTLCRRYLLLKADAWRVVRELRPELYRDLPRSADELVDELARLHREGVGDGAFSRLLRSRLLAWAKGRWLEMSSRWDVRLRTIATELGFRRETLATWGAEHAPELVAWMDAAEQRCRVVTKRKS